MRVRRSQIPDAGALGMVRSRTTSRGRSLWNDHVLVGGCGIHGTDRGRRRRRKFGLVRLAMLSV